MKRKKQSKLPSIKKNIEAFINEEEGAISKKDALNLGISLVMLGTVLAKSALAQHTSGGQHASNFSNTPTQGMHASGTPHSSATPHSNVSQHSSASRHSSCASGCHGSHSSCHASQHHSCHSDNDSGDR